MAERLVKVLTRRGTVGQVNMWGTLHLNTQGGRLAGWLCDSWTEAGTSAADVLLPRLSWLSKEDEKFHVVKLDIPITGPASIHVGPIDEKMEPRRESFLRDTLAQWEEEYLTTQGVSCSG